MPLLFWCDCCSRPLTAEEGTGGDPLECPACHSRCVVPEDAAVISARKAARIRRRSEKPVTPLETDVAGSHTLPSSSARPSTRLKPTSPRAGARGKQDYRELDRLYLPLDKRHVLRTRNLRLIPEEQNRRGGKRSYAEWAHVVGIFQTLLLIHLKQKTDNAFLDVGCGTGLMGIAAEPFLGEHGSYVGIDVMKPDVEFCRSHYPASTHSYIHLDVNNPAYAPEQDAPQSPWAVDTGAFDAVTALSVWTHLNEKDAVFYLREVRRVLKPGGMALISCFLLDDLYEKSVPSRNDEIGPYDSTPKNTWIFDQPAYGSKNWLCPGWAKVPEEAIGVTTDGLAQMLRDSGLRQRAYYPGNWNGHPGAFFQDVLIFERD